MTLAAPDQNLQYQHDEKDVVLSVKNVSKRFCRDLKRSLLYGVQDIASEVVGAKRTDVELRKGEFWALKDVSFELRRGEALGLVGANGAGKTTLLKIISGLIKPDHGSVEVVGRVAPLIALGAGFNPVLTGRENIYVNMSILGLSKQEIDERFEEVVDFAEIGEAIDAPVQSYSSGMQARLGFASAIFTEPDVLLVDEVLSVGDIKFQAKCHTQLSKLRDKNTSFILVSHNPQVILGTCDIALHLKKGANIMLGNANSVISDYEKDLFLIDSDIKQVGILLKPEKQKDKSLGLDIISLSFKNTQNELVHVLKSGDAVNIEITCKVHKCVDDLCLRINFYEVTGGSQPVQFISNVNDMKKFQLAPGKFNIKIHMPYLCFRPGTYDLKIIVREGPLKTLDYIESFRFTVLSDSSMHTCMFYQPHSWEVSQA